MNSYRVSFYKDLLNSDGHNFKCLQRQIEIEAACPSQAMMQAERLVHNERLDADCIEVIHLTNQHELEHNAAALQQTWSRAS